MSRTPVAMFVFRRPDTTKQVAEAVAAANPPFVLICRNGPREGHPEDVEPCRQTRAVLDAVDWPCEVRYLEHEVNVGLGWNFGHGLPWIFGQTDRAIILEDDCLPNPSFFRFCDELLERYADDPRVSMIAGTDMAFGKDVGPDSYYFARYGGIWGWASWRRTYEHYDIHMKDWPRLRESGWLDEMLDDRLTRTAIGDVFDTVHADETRAVWDYQWLFACWRSGGLAAVPRTSLVRNIGAEGGTNIKRRSVLVDIPTQELEFPLRHPERIERNRKVDAFVETMLGRRSRILRGMHRLRAVRRRRSMERRIARLSAPKGDS
jgi:hypothetical protein